MSSFLEPELEARYRDLVEIGRGGMGRVFKAWDQELERHVAIKILSASDFGGGGVRQRFLEEGRICSTLEHPNIVRLYDCGVPEILYPPYMIFEFIEGTSLEARLARGPLPLAEALGALVEVAEGLAHAHEAGIVHRDLKPENILLDGDGRARVADFGLAKDRGSSSGVRTRQGILLGTPPYMAPEYIKGSSMGPAADQYALGVLAFQLLTGKLPFEDPDNVKVLRMHIKEPVPDPRSLLPELDPELAGWIMRAMAKEPADRFSSVQSFARRLRDRRNPLERSLLRMSRPEGMDAPIQEQPSTRGFPRIQETLTGLFGDPRTSKGMRRRTRLGGSVAALLVLLTLYILLRTPPSEAESLVVSASPGALRARWVARGPTLLRVVDTRGTLASPDRVPASDGPCAQNITGLEADTDYLVSVRTVGGRVLQQTKLRTPEAGPLAPPRLELRGDPPEAHLLARARYPFSLTWSVYRREGNSWTVHATGGRADSFRTEHDLGVPDLDPGRPTQLRCRLTPVGSTTPIEHRVLDGTTLLRDRARAVMGPLAENRAEVLGQALDKLQDELRTKLTVDPLAVLEDSGFPAELRSILAAAERVLPDPEVPLDEKLEIERALMPLADLDVLLTGHSRQAATSLRRLRKTFLPFGPASTLAAGSRKLGTPWASEELFPETGIPSRTLFTDPFMDAHLQGDEVHGVLEWEIRHADIRAYGKAGRQSRLFFTLAEALPPGTQVELGLITRKWTHRHRLLLRINDRTEIVLWSAGARDGLEEAVIQGRLSSYRLPAHHLRAGPNVLSLRVHTLAGKDATMVPVHLLGATLLARP